jgi:hypothetical protein
MKPLIGKVSSRKCPVCGHHEVGMITQDGNFHPLKSGTRIQLNPAIEREAHRTEQIPPYPETGSRSQTGFTSWVPEPFKRDRRLRLKYGVLISGHVTAHQMIGGWYEIAYRDKLRRLIEKEVFTPIAVILDRFFAAPHLASGNPEDIAMAMWEELEEIRLPVLAVRSWLENPDDTDMKAFRDFQFEGATAGSSISDSDLRDALEALTLERFLEIL